MSSVTWQYSVVSNWSVGRRCALSRQLTDRKEISKQNSSVKWRSLQISETSKVGGSTGRPSKTIKSFTDWMMKKVTYFDNIGSNLQNMVHTNIYLFIYSFIYLFIYLCIYLLIFVPSIIHSFFCRLLVRSFIHLFVFSFVGLFVLLLVCSFVHSFIRPFVPSFIRPFVHSFIRSFIHWFIRWLVRFHVGSFIRSFVPITCSLYHAHAIHIFEWPLESWTQLRFTNWPTSCWRDQCWHDVCIVMSLSIVWFFSREIVVREQTIDIQESRNYYNQYFKQLFQKNFLQTVISNNFFKHFLFQIWQSSPAIKSLTAPSAECVSNKINSTLVDSFVTSQRYYLATERVSTGMAASH